MNETFWLFERIARTARNVGQKELDESSSLHPFDERNIHPDIAVVSIKLFDDGHYAQATFEAFKYIDNQVKTISGIEDTGFNLMMNAFNETGPKIKLTDLGTMSENDEQRGFRYIFAGTMSGIRNPRGHDNRIDPIDLCLDHLSVASVLLRTLEARKSPQ
ncbi:TIGR02391 family protein [Parvibaculum sp.]|uniref:TIGR02391 family protein n=1 Tax=Parvibaculum sp. TaxID=2024848 RepID=UPI00391BC8E6